MSYLQLANVIDYSFKNILVAQDNQYLLMNFAFTGFSNIRKENALMKMYLVGVDVDNVETLEDWARHNTEMWYALKVTGKVKKQGGGFAFVV